ncbi:MAG: hypothetical protein GC157_08570 [Frankiales bacterium]|nr:hypothetical protein [Frankiales bacterium]
MTGTRRRRALGALLPAALALAGCSVVPTTSTAPTSAPLTPAPTPPQLDLQLRPVLTAGIAGGGDCAVVAPATPDPAQPATLCSQDRVYVYSLGPARVTGARVTGLDVSWEAGRPVIEVRLDPRGAASLSRLTAEALVQQPPRSQVAIVTHGRVQAAPPITEQVDGGVMVLSGFASEAEARAALGFVESVPTSSATPSAGATGATSGSAPAAPDESASGSPTSS